MQLTAATTKSLAKAALFETEQEARQAALDYLADRRTNYGRKDRRSAEVVYSGSQHGYIVVIEQWDRRNWQLYLAH